MVERIILRNVQSSEELILDMVSTPDFVLKSVDWGTAKGKHHSYKYVNQIGASVTNTSLDTRDIKIEGWIVAADELHMTTLKKRLNMFINPQKELELIYSEYKIKFRPDESVKYSVIFKENNDVFCKFKIDGTAHNPLFSNVYERKLTFVNTEPVFHFPLVLSSTLEDGGIVFGKRTASLIAKVTNSGSVQIGMKFVFKANGTIVNPNLININTQEKFVINKTLVSGEEIEVNTNIGEKSVKGRIGDASQTNYYMYRDIDSSWLKLDIGENLFRYDATEGIENLDVFVSFNNQFLEVEECY